MSLQSIINSRVGIATILALGRLIPPSHGYQLADFVAAKLAKHKNAAMIRGLRANQWVVTGQKLDSESLDRQVEKTLRNIARAQYDLYHTLNNYSEIRRRVTLSPKLVELLDARLGKAEGTLMLAPHLSNFDLAGRAMALHGYKIQALSYPQPHGGYQWQNQLRQDIGIDITPMSTESLRKAKLNLKAGGGVITGLERPLPATNYFPRFFGLPAPVPVSYVRLALQTNAAILVVACIGTPQTNYCLDCSDLIYLMAYEDPIEEIEKNAESVLKVAEPFIRTYSDQWAMTYPLWLSALKEMP